MQWKLIVTEAVMHNSNYALNGSEVLRGFLFHDNNFAFFLIWQQIQLHINYKPLNLDTTFTVPFVSILGPAVSQMAKPIWSHLFAVGLYACCKMLYSLCKKPQAPNLSLCFWTTVSIKHPGFMFSCT